MNPRKEKLKQQQTELLQLKKALQNCITNVNKEILQTDVEWMNLTSLVHEKNSESTQPTQQTCKTELRMKNEQKDEKLQLNLNPATFNTGVNSDEELDSD